MIKNNTNLIENIDALIEVESIRSLILEKQNSIQNKDKNRWRAHKITKCLRKGLIWDSCELHPET